MGIESLDPFTGTSPFNRTELLNEMARYVQRIMSIEGGPGILLQNSDGGIVISAIDATGENSIVSSGGMFPVLVEKTGGSAGDKTTRCTFTYRVTSLNGEVEYGVGLSPAKTRMTIGKYVEGGAEGALSAIGAGYINGGQFVLWDANEVSAAAACS